jgi:hypothetical protein
LCLVILTDPTKIKNPGGGERKRLLAKIDFLLREGDPSLRLGREAGRAK